MNNKGGAAGLFNAVEIEAPLDDCIFIVEGAMDALSILEAGEAAVGLNSTSNVRQLLEKVEEHRPDATLILCLDNDERGWIVLL
jgi:replicative DNA helicase